MAMLLQVKSCSNGTLGAEGWQPVNVQAALAALNKNSKSNWSSSRSSSPSTNKWAGASGDKWLAVVSFFWSPSARGSGTHHKQAS